MDTKLTHIEELLKRLFIIDSTYRAELWDRIQNWTPAQLDKLEHFLSDLINLEENKLESQLKKNPNLATDLSALAQSTHAKATALYAAMLDEEDKSSIQKLIERIKHLS